MASAKEALKPEIHSICTLAAGLEHACGSCSQRWLSLLCIAQCSHHGSKYRKHSGISATLGPYKLQMMIPPKQSQDCPCLWRLVFSQSGLYCWQNKQDRCCGSGVPMSLLWNLTFLLEDFLWITVRVAGCQHVSHPKGNRHFISTSKTQDFV